MRILDQLNNLSKRDCLHYEFKYQRDYVSVKNLIDEAILIVQTLKKDQKLNEIINNKILPDLIRAEKEFRNVERLSLKELKKNNYFTFYRERAKENISELISLLNIQK